jgi:hypothetical protein
MIRGLGKNEYLNIEYDVENNLKRKSLPNYSSRQKIALISQRKVHFLTVEKMLI